jgi:hypothetical protein
MRNTESKRWLLVRQKCEERFLGVFKYFIYVDYLVMLISRLKVKNATISYFALLRGTRLEFFS